MNEIDWTDGLMIWQARVGARTEAECRTRSIGDACYPEFDSNDYENTTAFGR